jgi:hypothetical protein
MDLILDFNTFIPSPQEKTEAFPTQ